MIDQTRPRVVHTRAFKADFRHPRCTRGGELTPRHSTANYQSPTRDSPASAGIRVRSWVMQVILLLVTTSSAAAQQMTCGDAAMRLQQYVVQVNNFANSEYYQGIPYRCQGNPNCAGWWLNQLNAWYMQQAAMVNQWYSQISATCSAQADPPVEDPVRVSRSSTQEPGELEVEDIEVDEEDKTVRIRIPANPQGYVRQRPRRAPRYE